MIREAALFIVIFGDDILSRSLSVCVCVIFHTALVFLLLDPIFGYSLDYFSVYIYSVKLEWVACRRIVRYNYHLISKISTIVFVHYFLHDKVSLIKNHMAFLIFTALVTQQSIASPFSSHN